MAAKKGTPKKTAATTAKKKVMRKTAKRTVRKTTTARAAKKRVPKRLAAAKAKKKAMRKTAKRMVRKTTTARAAKKTKRTGRIVVFACSWYPSIAADNAGVVGLEYSADVRIVTLACAGRLTPSLVLDAFGAGAAGVLVAACKPELCHHVNGSSTCEQVVDETRKLAELLGIGAERIALETFDSEKGEPFVESVEGFRKKVGRLKPFVVEP